MMGNYKLGVAVLIGLVLAATGLWAAAADEEPAAAMEKEMVLDPTTGEMVSAPEYGGTITGLFHPGWETEHADMWHFRSVIHPTKLILERMGGGNWGPPRDEFTEATDARRSVIMENIFVLPGLGRVLLTALHGPGLPGRHGSEPVLRCGGAGGESADRPALSLSGPADPLPISTSCTWRNPRTRNVTGWSISWSDSSRPSRSEPPAGQSCWR